MSKEWKFQTKAVQAGYEPKPGEPRILPIYESTTFYYDSVDYVARLFDLKEEGHMYSRISNPTLEAFEKKIAALEGGVGALATSSGQAATMVSLVNVANAGEHIVAASTLYGGTYTLLSVTFKKLGIEVSFVHPDAEEDEIKAAFRPDTKALFAETIGNPGLNVLDFEKFSRIAHDMGVPLIIDNSFATPYLCRPFEHGADIVMHSTTKYIDGQARSVGGVVVDSGKFPWDNGKFPSFTEPDPAYHGIRYVESFGNAAYITKARVQFMRDIGLTMSPFTAFLLHMSLETLSLRMEKHSQNALALARYLKNNEKVAWVNYPGLEDSPYYDLAQKYLPLGCGGMLTFGLKGGLKEGKKFMENLKLASLVVHLGDTRTSVLHPASMTHRQLTEEEQRSAGVTPDLIRVSVGIEDIDDIINDFDQAINKAV
ncbi:O-acetylhomoserine aminocarboxypropyltransferase/cysteine synthase family protein [Thermosyntropha sp.]|uniref:O-acetylhomoserine aminocarboxypropyltransferase/cysteine synthase family protein n=1 Tax=Thermosyntropha sp. TaxID=2740820 RepID=UPI0025DE10E4|nr:O-acetylhomoserine aminocarboxypropyltransferase/cysteine synthase family protein [Thermosyntropha sp.]MBO8159616.1 O-acetylhomoserine aminocarboxypropyltransferase/cysteine synthase [Thermosyntropha sp.]